MPRKTAVLDPSCCRTSSVTRSLAVAVVARTAAFGALSSERESLVVGAEVEAPVADAVCFVDDDE